MATLFVKAMPLTKESFEPYGDVIETEGAKHFSINQGTVERYHDLATVEIGTNDDSRVLVSIAQCNQKSTIPHRITCLERHILGSQAFIPMGDMQMVIAVAEPSDNLDITNIRAFVSNGKQGINYKPGCWHMPAIFLDPEQQMLIIDRGNSEMDCEEVFLHDEEIIIKY